MKKVTGETIKIQMGPVPWLPPEYTKNNININKVYNKILDESRSLLLIKHGTINKLEAITKLKNNG